jgi:hypothetical protein
MGCILLRYIITLSSCSIGLGFTQPLKQMSAKNFLGRKGRPMRKSDILTAVCEPIFKKM